MKDILSPTLSTVTSTDSRKQNSLYIHIPFCPSGCKFCHFYIEGEKVSGYVNLLKKEFFLKFGESNLGHIRSILIGGGTPNLLSIEEMKELLKFIREKVSSWEEFTIELHPAFLNEEYIDLMKEYEVNRLSFGIQTIDVKVLKNHTRVGFSISHFERLLTYARSKHFIINFDFIYDLIGQDIDSLKRDIDFISLHKPDTIYYHQLRVITPEIKQQYRENEKRKIGFHFFIEKRLNEEGYKQVSPISYSRNSDIPSLYTYLHSVGDHSIIGLGVAATSHDDKRRYKNTLSVKSYQEKILLGELPIDLDFIIPETDYIYQALGHSFVCMNSLSLKNFWESWKIAPQKSLDPIIQRFVELGYFTFDGDRVTLSLKGRYRYTDIIKILFHDNKTGLQKLIAL